MLAEDSLLREDELELSETRLDEARGSVSESSEPLIELARRSSCCL